MVEERGGRFESYVGGRGLMLYITASIYMRSESYGQYQGVSGLMRHMVHWCMSALGISMNFVWRP